MIDFQGIGALFIKQSLQEGKKKHYHLYINNLGLNNESYPLVFGAPQEMGWRAGEKDLCLLLLIVFLFIRN